jgi:RNA polymerase-binding transcription factor DksA
MAKKTQKAKPAKKAAKSAKPAKKAVVKKPAKKAAPKKAVKKAIAKKIVKKALPKKAAKPAKKVVAKKVIKKAVKPVKKAATKKPVAKKPVPKKIIKKTLVKNMAKPVKKVVAKKVEKPTKKAVEKPIKEEKQKPAAKQPVKPEPKKEIEKPVVVAKPAEPIRKPEPVVKKKQRDMDDDNSRDEAPMVVEYKTPSIRKPMGPAPKPHINTDTRTRYSDAELKEFKELILKKLSEAQKDFELLKSTLSHKDDHGTDDTSPTFKLLEDGSDVLSKEETAHLASRQEKFIQNLQNALIRIENKTYGICRATGKLISKERLRSVPHATLAIEAKLEQNI